MGLISALATRVSPHMIETRSFPKLYMMLNIQVGPHMCTANTWRKDFISRCDAVLRAKDDANALAELAESLRLASSGGVRLQAKGKIPVAIHIS
jgi:hypothetical protein